MLQYCITSQKPQHFGTCLSVVTFTSKILQLRHIIYPDVIKIFRGFSVLLYITKVQRYPYPYITGTANHRAHTSLVERIWLPGYSLTSDPDRSMYLSECLPQIFDSDEAYVVLQ